MDKNIRYAILNTRTNSICRLDSENFGAIKNDYELRFIEDDTNGIEYWTNSYEEINKLFNTNETYSRELCCNIEWRKYRDVEYKIISAIINFC